MGSGCDDGGGCDDDGWDDPVGPAGPTHPIDPRLRARRMEVARARGRRRRRLLVAVAVLITVLGGAWLLAYRSPVLDIDQVTVRGADQISVAAVRRATGVSTGSALAGVDVNAVQRRVEAEPWVARAAVVRRWPATLQVTVTERTPVAVLGERSGAVLVDETGRALAPAPERVRLPSLRGVPVTPGERLGGSSRRLAGVLGDLPDDVREQVAQAGTSGGNLTFTLTDGVKVRWGDDRANGEKARSLTLLLNKADRGTIAGIDVSVPSAAAITRKDGPVA